MGESKENGKDATPEDSKETNGKGLENIGSGLHLEEDESISDFIPTPPDGGWGWVIVISSLFCNIIVDGIGYSFGIFLPEFVAFFGESRSKVSLIGSLLCGTYLCAGKCFCCCCFFLLIINTPVLKMDES